ncbi:hypothetical protein HPK00_14970 [Anoxybacillus flavithermus]|nr:hypothetical protein [Anoxybacillus flavithermus]
MQIKDFMVDRNLKELTEHRTVALPVACYETIINQNVHGYIPLHWHDELQFIPVIKVNPFFKLMGKISLLEKEKGCLLIVAVCIWQKIWMIRIVLIFA